MSERWTVLPAGDRALVLEFGQEIDHETVQRIAALDRQLNGARQSGQLTGVIETVPTFRSLAILFDPLQTRPDTLLAQIRALEEPAVDDQTLAPRHWQIPVLHSPQAAPDLPSVANATGMSTDEVIALHQQTSFSVYMLGFLPGFAFMGQTPEALHLPRRGEPRTRVPAGSVAIANQLTGIYPWESPGGWHIIGHSPVPLFDARLNPPALLRAGDVVRFHSIDEKTHQALSRDVASGRFERESLQFSDE